jgi:hypothetical protein
MFYSYKRPVRSGEWWAVSEGEQVKERKDKEK